MKKLQLLLQDRRRRQRGSVLSALLIIVAFLSILSGALLTELTDSFLVSRDLVSQVNTQATVTSGAELAIQELETSAVPPLCSHDVPGLPKNVRGPWSLSLNGHSASVSQTCTAILPEQATGLSAGQYRFDGIHDTVAGQNRYLIADAAGRLFSYPFGQTGQSWSIGLGGAPTASLLTALDPDGSVNIVIPSAKSGGDCAGHCVVVFNERTRASLPAFSCNLAADATVSAPAAAEVTGGGSANFPAYIFFADSGRLYVYDASFGGSCPQLDSVALNGKVVGAPLVFPGSTNGNSVSDEIFVVVTSSAGTSLQHWQYAETGDNGDGNGDGNGNGRGNNQSSLSLVGSLVLPGADSVGYGISSTVPRSGTSLSLAVATTGRLDLARIAVKSGPSYSTSLVTSMVLPNGAVTTRAPYWCPSPCGPLNQSVIAVGGTNGFLYLFNSTLTTTLYLYSGQPDGFPPITTTPVAGPNGDWYFGANDGSVYDVEIPVSGVQMVKAAKFGPGGVISSSPIVGACPGGLVGPCMYFGSSTDSFYVRIGTTRISDLRACLTATPGATACTANPRLWARVQIGPGSIWGGTGIYVQGWSFYSQ